MVIKYVLWPQMYFGDGEEKEKLKIRNYLKILQREFYFYPPPPPAMTVLIFRIQSDL